MPADLNALVYEYNDLEKKRVTIVKEMADVRGRIGDIISSFKVDDRITWGRKRVKRGRILKIHASISSWDDKPTVDYWEVAETFKNGGTRNTKVYSFDKPVKESAC